MKYIEYFICSEKVRLIRAEGQIYGEDSVGSDPFSVPMVWTKSEWWEIKWIFLHQAVMSCRCSALSACFLSRQHARAGCWCPLSPQELMAAGAQWPSKGPSGDDWDLPEKQATIQCATQYSQHEILEEKAHVLYKFTIVHNLRICWNIWKHPFALIPSTNNWRQRVLKPWQSMTQHSPRQSAAITNHHYVEYKSTVRCNWLLKTNKALLQTMWKQTLAPYFIRFQRLAGI